MSTHIGARHHRDQLDLAALAEQLLQIVHSPVVLWDPAGFPVVFNDACLQVFGYTAAEFAILNRRELESPGKQDEGTNLASVGGDGLAEPGEGRRRLRSRQMDLVEVDCSSVEIPLNDGSLGTLVEYLDVTELVSAQAALRRHEQLYEDFVENSSGVTFTTGSDNRFVTANQAWLELLGISVQELRTKTLAELVHPDHEPRALGTREARNVGRNVNSFVLPVRAANGDLRWVDLDLHSVMDEFGRLLGMQGFGHDVTDEHEERERLLEEASTDGLTGLANRRHFDEFLEEQVASAVRYETPLSLITLDLDHFKRLNDQYGHPAGDDVLREISRILNAAGRESDLVARYGGEEFALVLPHTDARGALLAAERCARAIQAAEVQHDGKIIRVTASFGIATFDQLTHRNAAGLLEAADQAVYAAKDAGRNTVRVEGRLAA